MTYEAVTLLGHLAEVRGGLVTAAQASAAGVSPFQVSRMADAGVLIPVGRRGVYRMVGAPELEHEDITATWLSLKGIDAPASEHGAQGLVVAGVDAALLHGLGDFYPGDHELISASRKTTRQSDVRIRHAQLHPEEVTWAASVPVLTVERMIADLMATWVESSLVIDVVRDAIQAGRLVHPHRLSEALAPLAAARGFAAGDGVAVAEWLYEHAGLQPLGAVA
ncbi:type IV toxin-antitoxin system AbiEi family antitoxin domain-containing protein [Arthrobacter sp. Y-9]|uniref:type IV toxin-antitoxin system AbiEi family antitoxin domain-containing protein n=1 Tax=Arthrobacter sp. Y-9 TaxID=3039385 RepID=UPI00241D38DB|nr:type IV toxin-antitoxin system AbiEi family antitoxin domain-containing protein [Arthrobacter sp. Y-9]WFR83698.1 type IV toxin-antitoxin system AbiEi family antitoxin domain-containing protein [Arthrobacter sp. Y-9]